MTTITAEELKAIRARCEAATPGPWSLVDEEVRHCIHIPAHRHPIIITMSINEEADTNFIVHAREDVPRLLDALEAANGRVAMLDSTEDLENRKIRFRLAAAEVRAEHAELQAERLGSAIHDALGRTTVERTQTTKQLIADVRYLARLSSD